MNDVVPARALVSRATALLRERRYADAWPLYEARKQAGFDVLRVAADYPEWRGEDLAGKRLAVCAEQGWGDQMMFGRWLPLLEARGAEIILVVNPYFVARLFETRGYSARPCFTDRPLPKADYWVHFGSLPLRLGVPAPPPAAYLPVPLSSGGGVGVIASGSPTDHNDANRSLPPDQAARLLRLGRDLSKEATGAFDFLDTAHIVAGLDLVITVDTAVAHLAGALGKPCWVLLPREGLDWRWNDGVRSDWYPDFRLFRQATPGDWASVIDQVESLKT